jgi:hypothetical protein
MARSFTSELARELSEPLLERFDRYVRIDTQSDRDHASDRVPSSDNQLDLARVLMADLRDAGLDDVDLDAHGTVTATLAGTSADAASPPVIGLIAHMDTSPDAPGAGVEPIVHRDYDGGIIELPRAGTRLDPAATRCSAPTTRPASPRSSPRSLTSPPIPSCRARRSASRSPATRRSGRELAASTSRRSAPTVPTPSTAPSSVACRTRRSRPTRQRSPSPASTSIRDRRPGRWSTRCGSSPRSSPRCRLTTSRPRRPPDARDSCIPLR